MSHHKLADRDCLSTKRNLLRQEHFLTSLKLYLFNKYPSRSDSTQPRSIRTPLWSLKVTESHSVISIKSNLVLAELYLLFFLAQSDGLPEFDEATNLWKLPCGSLFDSRGSGKRFERNLNMTVQKKIFKLPACSREFWRRKFRSWGVCYLDVNSSDEV